MAALNFCDGREVGRAAGGCAQDCGSLAEEVGAEDAGSDDGECPGSGGAEIVEAMHGSAGDDDGLARRECDGLAVDGEGEGAFEAVKSLFVGIVAVCSGNLATGFYIELEHGEGAVGFVPFDEITDRDTADLNFFLRGHGWVSLLSNEGITRICERTGCCAGCGVGA